MFATNNNFIELPVENSKMNSSAARFVANSVLNNVISVNLVMVVSLLLVLIILGPEVWMS